MKNKKGLFLMDADEKYTTLEKSLLAFGVILGILGVIMLGFILAIILLSKGA